MTDTRQLNRWMRHDPTYLGAFPLNVLPSTSSGHCCFIVNTHPANLSGQHWIAVRIRERVAWIFDPLSYPPLAELCEHLLQRLNCSALHFCKTPAQPAFSQTCGQHCVYFLRTGNAAPSETVLLHSVYK